MSYGDFSDHPGGTDEAARGGSVRNVLIPLREGSHSLSGENQHPGHGEDDRRNDQGLAGNRLVIPEVCIA